MEKFYIENAYRGYHIVLANNKTKSICNMMTLTPGQQKVLLTKPPKNRNLCKDCELVMEMVELKTN